ncbi:DNA repair helicase [Halobacteriales archaeon QS_3_64_16]|nr:MAG: DNA repair helicase [Halobacteriales archaeon QS_3_64_16]
MHKSTKPREADEALTVAPLNGPTVSGVRLVFENGTVRIDVATDAADSRGNDATDAESILESLPFVERDPRSETYRTPAYRYASLREALAAAGITLEDRVFDLPDLDLETAYELRSYQREALDAWGANDDRGVLELPTGSGKTVIGLAAIASLGTSTLVVVPTIDLLGQWRAELETEFGMAEGKAGDSAEKREIGEIGQLGGGIQQVGSITVSTYDSAYLRADELGDRFGLVVFDEAHHLGGEGYREIARLLAAPARLGLTATLERPDGAQEVVADLCGPLVHRVAVDDLAGTHLADYDVKRIEVSLSEAERAAYDDHQGTFVEYLRNSNLDMRSGNDYQKLVMRSGNDPRAREALLAKQRAREVMMNADAKVATLASILGRHREDRVLMFTAHNDLVYRLSERFLLPAITHRTGAAERRDVLEKFRSGEYSRIVASNVLDEGIDVPDANVAVVLSGSGSQREFTQRLGRILRPGESKRALLYEVVTEETAEERVADRRR